MRATPRTITIRSRSLAVSNGDALLSPMVAWLTELRATRAEQTWAPMRKECGVPEATWYGHVLTHPEHAIDPLTRDRLTRLGKSRAEIDELCGPDTGHSRTHRTRRIRGQRFGPKPKVTDEKIRERCALADAQHEPLDVVAADLGISTRILSKHRRRLGLTGRRDSVVRAAGQKRRNARDPHHSREVLPSLGVNRRIELLEDPVEGSARRERIAVVARRTGLSSLGQQRLHELFEDPAEGPRLRESRAQGARMGHATQDRDNPGWRQRLHPTMHVIMSKTLGPRWHHVVAAVPKAPTAQTRLKLSESGQRRAARQGSNYFAVLGRLRGCRTTTDLMILEYEVRESPALVKVVRSHLGHRRGPHPTYTLAEVHGYLEERLNAKQIASKLAVTVQHARRLIRLVRDLAP
jgi:hypothetical protein